MNNMSACACMGPQDNDPYCPCVMRQKGLTPSVGKTVVYTVSDPINYRPGVSGCSDGNCIFQDNSIGMHTNGGCSCERELNRTITGRKAAMTVRWLRQMLSTKDKL